MKILSDMFRRVPAEQLNGEDAEGHAHGEGHGLQRSLTAKSLIVMGIAAIIGTGIFVLPGVAAYKHAGPAVILSFALCGLLCAAVAMCYAEFASMMRGSGSAFMYSYAVFGELIAWIIGWDLLLEYAFGASGVAVGWSAYFQKILHGFGLVLPEHLSKAPEHMPWSALGLSALIVGGAVAIRAGALNLLERTGFGETSGHIGARLARWALLLGVCAVCAWTITLYPSVDLPAMVAVALVSGLLCFGVHHTAKASAIFVAVKLLVIVAFIGVGVWHISLANLSPFIPARQPLTIGEHTHLAYGLQGILSGAAVVFFAFIGFDGVTTAAGETKDPQKDVPLGVLGSLAICTVAYMLVAIVMVGCLSYTMLGGAAPIATVLEHIGKDWGIGQFGQDLVVGIISVGALAGITSALILSLYGQSRVQMAMSNRGLMPAFLGKVSKRFHTPVNAIVIWGMIAAPVAGLIPIEELSELTNIGTLAAFTVVCLGIVWLRYMEPNRERKFLCPSLVAPVVTFFGRLFTRNSQFKCSWLPDIPLAGAFGCVAFMGSLPWMTWERFIWWMAIGIGVYLVFGRKHSKLNETDKKAS